MPPIGVRVLLVVVWALAVGAVSLRAPPVTVTLVLVAGFTTGGLLLGATRHAAALETPLAQWFADQPGADTGRVGPVLLEGRLRGDAMETDFGVSLRLRVRRVGRPGAMRTTSGGVRLSVGGRQWLGRVAGWRAGARPAGLRDAPTARGLPQPGRVGPGATAGETGDGVARVGEKRAACRGGAARFGAGGIGRERARRGSSGHPAVGRPPRCPVGGHRDRRAHRRSHRSRRGDDPPAAGGRNLSRHRHLWWQHRDSRRVSAAAWPVGRVETPPGVGRGHPPVGCLCLPGWARGVGGAGDHRGRRGVGRRPARPPDAAGQRAGGGRDRHRAGLAARGP